MLCSGGCCTMASERMSEPWGGGEWGDGGGGEEEVGWGDAES